MKKIALCLMINLMGSSLVFADLIKTTSESPNASFPRSEAEIKKMDQMSIQASIAFGGKPVGALLSYACESNVDYIKCTFKHDLPTDWDWYGHFNITFEQDSSPKGATSVVQNWVEN